MKTNKFSGVFTALATPMRGGEVAYGDLEALVAHQLAGGINGLVPVGTTGESPTLTHEEHIEVVRATVKAASGKVPVYAGTGSNSTDEAVEMEPISPEDIKEFIEQSVPEQFFGDWARERQVDDSYRVENIGRFRVNCFLQRGLPSVVMRHVSDHPPTFEDLNTDGGVLSRLCAEKDGLVLLCGATGSGKSSTLAAMINHINQEYDKHIVTLEDPIEFTSHPASHRTESKSQVRRPAAVELGSGQTLPMIRQRTRIQSS